MLMIAGNGRDYHHSVLAGPNGLIPSPISALLPSPPLSRPNTGHTHSNAVTYCSDTSSFWKLSGLTRLASSREIHNCLHTLSYKLVISGLFTDLT